MSSISQSRVNPHIHRRLAIALTSLLFWALLPGAFAAETSKEYQLKAAFLYNFAKFVEWPSNAFLSAGKPIVIGIVGANPFGGDLEKAVKDRSINGHPVEIRLVDDTVASGSVHVLFFGPGQDKSRARVLGRMASAPILTVGESDHFIEEGGMINFVFEADKVRFEINSQAADRAGLRISANLQKLATKVCLK